MILMESHMNLILPTEAEEEENDIFEVQNKSKGKQP